MVVPEWKPITDLEVDPQSLTDGEMRWLGEAWRDYRVWLEKSGGLTKFETAFNREWAIEAGIVERVYTLDRGVTETLIERGTGIANPEARQ